MKNKIIASVILVMLGAAFIAAAYQFAQLAYAAPATTVEHSTAPTILEFAYGLPAVIFTCAAVVAIIAAAVVATITLMTEKPVS